MTRGGLFADTKCPYSASRVKSWTYLWVADAKPSATQYHPVGVVLIMQSPRWLTTNLLCSYFDRESRVASTAGAIDGIWGSDTNAAIKRFQHSLAVTGDLTAVTARAAAQHGERR